MTQEEKTLHLEQKKKAASMLRRIIRQPSARQVAAIDSVPRLRDYLEEVAQHPKRHNEYEIKGVLVFLKKVDIYAFDSRTVKKFCRFYNCLPFDGPEGTTNYELTPVQVYIVSNIFGLKTTNRQGEEIRLIRDAYIFCPRKFAKTTFSAALAVWFLLMESYNSQAYFIANSLDQAKVAFNMMRGIMTSLDPDGKMFRVNRETIFFENRSSDNYRASFAKCLAANPKNLDGLFAELVIRDEGAQARDTATKNGSDLKNVLTSSEGPRKQPLNIDITTASEVIDGPFVRELKGVYNIIDSCQTRHKNAVTDNDTLFAILFQPDVDDDDLGDPKLWAKVQPHMGITVQPDYYEKEWLRAQISPENMLTFKTKLLNLFAVNDAETWISREVAVRAQYRGDFWGAVRNYANIYGAPIAYAAVDLSTDGDFTAASVDIYLEAIKQHWIYTRYFFPDGVHVWDDVDANGNVVRSEDAPFDGRIHSNHPNKFLYQTWASAGHLTLTHGEVVDYTPLVEWLLELANCEWLDVRAVGYDDWKATEFVNMMAAAQGHKQGLVPLGQTPSEFTVPCMVFKQLLCTGHIYLDDNPINAYCFHAILLTDKMGNVKPCKPAETKRIDGMITMLMALKQHVETGHRQRRNDLE